MTGTIDKTTGTVKYPSGMVRPLAIARTVSGSPRLVEIVGSVGSYIIVAKPLTSHEVPFPRDHIFKLSQSLEKLAERTDTGNQDLSRPGIWKNEELFE